MAKAKAASLGDIVKGVIKDLGKKRVTEEDMAKAWEETAGKKAAKHTKPVSLKKARLTVNVDSSVWLYELSTRKKELVAGLTEKLDKKKIKEIRFRVGEI